MRTLYLVKLVIYGRLYDKNMTQLSFTISQGVGGDQRVMSASDVAWNGSNQRTEFRFSSHVTDLVPVAISGDCLFKFYSKDKVVFYFWLNTFFVRDESTHFTKFQIDKLHKSNCDLVSDDFAIKLVTVDCVDKLCLR